MSDLWTPNQTPAPCRCVKYNPAPEPGKCGTCGGRLPEETAPTFAEALRQALHIPYQRTNADAVRNQGDQERGLIGC